MSPDSPPKTSTRGPLSSSCVGHTSREPRVSAAADTWPTTGWRSSCFCPILSRCRSRSLARSTSTPGPATSRWPASKVGHTESTESRWIVKSAVESVHWRGPWWSLGMIQCLRGPAGVLLGQTSTEKCRPLVEQWACYFDIYANLWLHTFTINVRA